MILRNIFESIFGTFIYRLASTKIIQIGILQCDCIIYRFSINLQLPISNIVLSSNQIHLFFTELITSSRLLPCIQESKLYDNSTRTQFVMDSGTKTLRQVETRSLSAGAIFPL